MIQIKKILRKNRKILLILFLLGLSWRLLGWRLLECGKVGVGGINCGGGLWIGIILITIE